MALLNITKAALRAGITRQYLHRHYIKQGLLSVTKDAKGNSFIDTTEILRVFGKLHGDENKIDNSLHEVTQTIDNENKFLQLEVEALRNVVLLKNELLAEKDKRIDDLRSSLLLLSDNTNKAQPRKKYFGLF